MKCLQCWKMCVDDVVQNKLFILAYEFSCSQGVRYRGKTLGEQYQEPNLFYQQLPVDSVYVLEVFTHCR